MDEALIYAAGDAYLIGSGDKAWEAARFGYRAGLAARSLAEPVAYLYEDDARELSEEGEALVYRQRQRFVRLPEPACTPLYAHPPAEPVAREPIGAELLDVGTWWTHVKTDGNYQIIAKANMAQRATVPEVAGSNKPTDFAVEVGAQTAPPAQARRLQIIDGKPTYVLVPAPPDTDSLVRRARDYAGHAPPFDLLRDLTNAIEARDREIQTQRGANQLLGDAVDRASTKLEQAEAHAAAMLAGATAVFGAPPRHYTETSRAMWLIGNLQTRCAALEKALAELVACWEWYRDKKWSTTPEGAERDYQERAAIDRRQERAIAAARAALAEQEQPK